MVFLYISTGARITTRKRLATEARSLGSNFQTEPLPSEHTYKHMYQPRGNAAYLPSSHSHPNNHRTLFAEPWQRDMGSYFPNPINPQNQIRSILNGDGPKQFTALSRWPQVYSPLPRKRTDL